MKYSNIFKSLNIHESWWKLFEKLFDDPRMLDIQKELNKNQFVPNKSDIFKAFSIDKNKVKVIILGQDPYPDPKHPMGIAFGTKSDIIPYSLNAIYDCMSFCYGDITVGTDSKQDHTLGYLQDQGILLLNSSLTTKRHHPGLHGFLWRYFIKAVIEDTDFKVFVRLGQKAQSFNKEGVVIIDEVHPASQKYSNNDKFKKSNLFVKIDKALENQIKWYI